MTGWRPFALAVALVLAGVLLAGAPSSASSDVFDNVAPASPLPAGVAERYPLGNYALDAHFPAVEASLTGGVDASGVAPTIAHFLANTLWQLTAFLADTLVTLFVFAFSLDLVRGSHTTDGAGALEPVGEAIRALYTDVLGQPWLVLAITGAGVWAMWRGLIQRRYTETAGALGLSLVYVLVALAFVTQPERTVGEAVRWTNQLSLAFLSLSSQADPSGSRDARRAAADQLFSLLVHEPWTVLQFGGREHCVRTGTGSADDNPRSVPVRPLARDPATDAQLARRLAAGTELQAAGKTCVNNVNKYADRFLRHPPGSDERDAEYQALNEADTGKLSEAAGYRLSVADKPAVDAMEEGGQYQRLLMALVVFAGELGAFLLLGALCVGVTLAQVLLLLLVAFAPVALILATIPGRGHAFFQGWVARLAGFLLRKAAYSLTLAILLAVNAALAQATSSLGWLLSFGLQALLFWSVFLYRRQLTGQLLAATVGPGDTSEAGRFAAVYTASRLATRRLGRLSRTPAHSRRDHHNTVADDSKPAQPERPPDQPPRSSASHGAPSQLADQPALSTTTSGRVDTEAPTGPPSGSPVGHPAPEHGHREQEVGAPKPLSSGRRGNAHAGADQRSGEDDAAVRGRQGAGERPEARADEPSDPRQRDRSDDNPLRSELRADRRRLDEPTEDPGP